MFEVVLESNRENELAARAALAPAHEALEAWTLLMEQVPFDEVNLNTQRLAPAIFSNLRQVRSFSERERLKGTYKYTWTKTTRLIHSIEPVLRAFDNACLDYRVIKGLATQVLLNTVGSRTMGDIDILFGERDIGEAIEIVRSLGYRRTEDVPCSGHSPSGHFQGLNFSLGETHLDFHVAETKHPQELFISMLKSPPEIIRWGSIDIRVPGPEFLFLHAIVHGELSAGPTDLIQAVSDVVNLQKSVDMARATVLARQTRLQASIIGFRKSVNQAGLMVLGLSMPESGRGRRHRVRAIRTQLLENTDSRTLLRRIQARRIGRGITVDYENQRLTARIFYRIWLLTGQIAILERWIRTFIGGMLKKPAVPISNGLTIRPFRRETSHAQLTALRVADTTIDWRFRVTLPSDTKKLLVHVRADALATLDIWAFVNGVQLCRLVGGDVSTHVLTIHKPSENLEISLRPVWLACRLCFSGFNDMELEFTLQGGSVDA